jgi:D-glycero-D-manno-heptose 1,7-bisphosphate phosphatase
MHRAVFLDRDGVINRKAITEGEYVTTWAKMQILPGVCEAISRLNRVGFKVIIVTNQRAIAKGLMTEAELESLHVDMCRYLAKSNAKIDGVYYCPHELEPPCNCRKPQPGMLLQAAKAHSIALSDSWMVGDSDKDVEAGRRAGCRTVRLVGSSPRVDHKADLVAPSLLDAIAKILDL